MGKSETETQNKLIKGKLMSGLLLWASGSQLRWESSKKQSWAYIWIVRPQRTREAEILMSKILPSLGWWLSWGISLCCTSGLSLAVLQHVCSFADVFSSREMAGVQGPFHSCGKTHVGSGDVALLQLSMLWNCKSVFKSFLWTITLPSIFWFLKIILFLIYINCNIRWIPLRRCYF